MLNSAIDQYLKRIANVLLLNANFTDNIGLLNGKTGIAIFFFHYARYTGNEFYKEFADELLDEVFEEIYQNSEINYADGLAGLGTGIEYLVKNSFIKADTNEVLEEIDLQMHHHADYHLPKSIDLIYGKCGFGKYFAARLNNHTNVEARVATINERALERIVNMLNKSYNTYFNLLSVIQFLSDITTLNVNQVKAEAYLNYAIDKLETMVYEDVHFGTYPGTFNPLSTAVVLIQATEKVGNKEYTERALHFLKMYETDFRKYLTSDYTNLPSNSLKWSLLYNYLGIKLEDNTYKQLSEDWLNTAITEGKESLAGFRVMEHSNLPSMGILYGYAGVGLTLLTIIDKCSPDWFNLIPLQLEIEKTVKIPTQVLNSKSFITELQNI